MTRSILHMISPLKHMSPFDVNMAADAGFDVVVPYTGVTLQEMTGLVQDSIFSRAPQDGSRTGLFIAGKNAELALDMLDAARHAFVPPFANHVFADPAGSFTTGAALVAVVAKVLRERRGEDLNGKRVVIYGGTGVVAYCAGVLAAQAGAEVALVGHDGAERVTRIADSMKRRFGVAVSGVDGSRPEQRREIVSGAHVALAAAAAGVRVLTAEDLAAAPGLLVAADVNAVPPSGIEGVDVHASGDPLPGSEVLGIGALAVGNVKYGTQAGLLRRMLETREPLALDFRDAYALAVELAA
jgi:methylene-tetrahydromethanopterin dehydrogenase